MMSRIHDLVAAIFVLSSCAAGGPAPGSPQSAAAPSATGASPSAAWKEFEKAVQTVEKTERGTLSVAQVRKAIRSLSQRIGQSENVGQGPMGVERYINEQLLPQALQTKNEMQHEVDTAAQRVEDCGSLLWSAEKEVEHRESILLKDESGRYQCIAREHQLHKIEVDNCNNLVTFQRNLQPPTSINNVSKTPSAMKEALIMNYEFYNAAFPQFTQLKTACDDAADAAAAQLAECDADESVIEEFYCKMKARRDEACSAYDDCYDEKAAQMTKRLEKVRQLEEHVKQQFQSMSCFGHAFGEDSDSDEGDSAECDPNAYETNHLDVQYPNEPQKQRCVSLMNTRRNYSEVVCDGDTVVSGVASRGNGGVSGNSSAPTQAPGNNSGNSSLLMTA